MVNALRIFSRLDESGIKSIDVCESIDSVLIILRYQLGLKNGIINIEVVKDYQEMPSFLGHANLFNQTLLNLLQNAIDTLVLKIDSVVDPDFQPTIWISTSITHTDEIQVCIRDNGVGIAKENEMHLFEPFFTTKPIGQGVGLGLFTSHQIVTKLHQGQLTYQANPTGGAEFIISIPISRE